MTLGELVKLFDDYNFSVGKRPATRRWHVSALRIFVEYAGPARPVEDVSTDLVDLYRGELLKRGLAACSVNTYLRSLKSLLMWSKKKGHTKHLVEVERVRVEPASPKPVFAVGDFAELVKSAALESSTLASRRALAIIHLLLDTGLRASEVIAIKSSHIITTDYGKILSVVGAKGGKVRFVPLSPATIAAVEAYQQSRADFDGLESAYLLVSTRKRDNGNPLTVSGLRSICNRLADRAGIQANPHKFRRAFATFWLNEGGGDIESLMQIGGWSDRETVLRHYATIRTDTLIRAHSRFSPLSQAG